MRRRSHAVLGGLMTPAGRPAAADAEPTGVAPDPAARSRARPPRAAGPVPVRRPTAQAADARPQPTTDGP